MRELRWSPVPAELLVEMVSTAAVQQPDTSGSLAMNWSVSLVAALFVFLARNVLESSSTHRLRSWLLRV